MRDLVEHVWNAIEPVERIDDDRHNAEQEADRDLRQIAEAEEHDQQRIEREHWYRVIRSKQRLEYATDGGQRMNDRRRDNAYDQGGRNRCRDVAERHLQIGCVSAGHENKLRIVLPPPSDVRMPSTLTPASLKKPFSSATANGMPFGETP